MGVGSKGKGKAVYIQAWTGPQGLRKLRLPQFLDSVHMKVVRLSALSTSHLYAREISLLFISVRHGVEPRAVVRPEGLSR